MYAIVEKKCAMVRTPYTVSHEGALCPEEVDGRPLQLKWCRTEYAQTQTLNTTYEVESGRAEMFGL